MKYKNGSAFRRALEDRLRTRSLRSGVPLVRLRKMVAFDRFLARLLLHQLDRWVVKGGLAIQLRLGERARTTKDIDMLVLAQKREIFPALRSAGALDLGDWFIFEVSDILERTPQDFGGIRYQLQAVLDGRTYERFHIDIGSGDPLIDPVEYLRTPALLEFADIKPVIVPCYPITQQIAEKVHAYTRPYPSGESTRVKDIVDILLLAEMGEIDSERLLRAIQATFDIRQTHILPTRLPQPPGDWPQPFQRMVDEVELGYGSLDDANEALQQFLNPVLRGEITRTWDPSHWNWR